MNYILVKEVSEKWEISVRRIQKLCEENRIESVIKMGRMWLIPQIVTKPVDNRCKK